MSPVNSECNLGTDSKGIKRGPLARGPRSLGRHSGETPSEIEEQILQAIEGIRFGSVAVTLQDGVVVQIEKNERHRPAR